jgi:hypothetical protein
MGDCTYNLRGEGENWRFSDDVGIAVDSRNPGDLPDILTRNKKDLRFLKAKTHFRALTRTSSNSNPPPVLPVSPYI